MNPDLNYLIALHKSADLRQAADQTRLAQDAGAMCAEGRREALTAHTIVRLQLRGVGRGRLRIRRAD